MSADGSITFTWADADYRFRLPIGQIRELQDKCDAGPATIMRRLVNGEWRLDDIRETIRLGLIGGGKSPGEALTLVTRYVDARPLMESVQPAQAVLMAALVGDPKDSAGKEEPEEAETSPETTGSPSPDFMGPALS